MRHGRPWMVGLLGVAILVAAGFGRGQAPPSLPHDLEKVAVPLPQSSEIIAAGGASSEFGMEREAPGPAPRATPGVRQASFALPDVPPPPVTGPPAPPPAVPPGPGPSADRPPPLPPPPGALQGVPRGREEPSGSSVRGSATLTLEVFGQPRLAAGEAAVFEIVALNKGAKAISRVRVELPPPVGARLLRCLPTGEMQAERLAWELGTINAREEKRVRLEYLAVVPGDVTLAPMATFTPAPVTIPVVRAPFTLVVTGPEIAHPGDRVVFQVQVANHSEKELAGVVVQVQLPAGLYHPEADPARNKDADPKRRLAAKIGTLAPGASRTFPLETNVLAPGEQLLDVVARDETGLTSQTRTLVNVTAPQLALRFVGPREGTLGKDLEVRLEVQNTSHTTMNNVRLEQSLPQGLEVVSATTSALTAPGGRGLVWALPVLAAGEKQVVACTLRPHIAGDWPLYAAATGEGFEARAGHGVHVEGPPLLSVELLSGDEVLTAGAEMVYEVRLHNVGAVAARNVRLAAVLPDEVAPMQPQGPTEARIQGGQVIFAALAGLAPRGEAVYRVRVRGVRPGQGRLRVEVGSDSLAHPLQEEIGVRVAN